MKNTEVSSRRAFLKKAAYAAPAVIALGTLTNPTSAHASHISCPHNMKCGSGGTGGGMSGMSPREWKKMKKNKMADS